MDLVQHPRNVQLDATGTAGAAAKTGSAKAKSEGLVRALAGDDKAAAVDGPSWRIAMNVARVTSRNMADLRVRVDIKSDTAVRGVAPPLMLAPKLCHRCLVALSVRRLRPRILSRA